MPISAPPAGVEGYPITGQVDLDPQVALAENQDYDSTRAWATYPICLDGPAVRSVSNVLWLNGSSQHAR